MLQDDDLGKPVAMLLDTIAHVLGVNRRIDIQVAVRTLGAFSIGLCFPLDLRIGLTQGLRTLNLHSPPAGVYTQSRQRFLPQRKR